MNFKVKILIVGNARLPQNAVIIGFYDSFDFLPLKYNCIKDDVFIDDGITGTTFDRPEFQQMIQDIEDKKINCVVTKDLSRLGRNRLESARYREEFIERGIRFIATHDSYDNKDEADPTTNYDIATPIKEMMYEHYAFEVSRKVRASKKNMATQGKFSNSRPPYGYLKSPENKHVLIIDERISYNVVRIFDLYLSGKTGRGIAEIFNREGIITPNEYYYKSIGKPNPYKNNKNMWGSGTIMNIIKNPTYRGAIVNGKRKVTSFKNKRVIQQPVDDWIIVEATTS